MGEAPRMRSALLIVNYGAHRLIDENLARTQIPDGMIVVVVDNFSTDEERAAIRDLATRREWLLIEPERNLGFGEGMNIAAARAFDEGAEVLLLLNPDAYIEGDGAERLATKASERIDAVLSPLVLRPDRRHFSSVMEIDMGTGEMRRLIPDRRYPQSRRWLSGACLAVSASLWRRIGGFAPDYFLYWEDIDFSVRAAEEGADLYVDESVLAIHDEGLTHADRGSTPGKSPTYYFYNVRNRYVFAAAHLPPEAQRRWRRAALPAAWAILMRGGRRQLLHPSRNLVPAARGMLSGLRYLRSHATRGRA